MPLLDTSLTDAANLISKAKSILLLSHIRPDGDAIGSLVGFGLALETSGKTIQMVIDDAIPRSLRHLDGVSYIQRRVTGDFDLAIMLDCSDAERAGDGLPLGRETDINIDHHVTNLEFGVINLIDTQASATSEIIADILPHFGLQLTRSVSEALMTGLITDTLGFRTSNVTPKTFRTAASLLESEIDLPELYQKALVNRSFEAVKFWGAGLKQLEREDRIVWTTLTMADRKEAGYSGRDDADLINILSSLEDIDAAVIFVEQPNQNIKVSWRAQPEFDVSKIATKFGGGGHPSASGAEIAGSLAEVQKAVLELTRSLINGGKSVS